MEDFSQEKLVWKMAIAFIILITAMSMLALRQDFRKQDACRERGFQYHNAGYCFNDATGEVSPLK